MHRASVLMTVVLLAGGVVGIWAQDDRSFIEAQIKNWQQVVARNPKDYETLAAIGGAYGKLGEHAIAVTYFKKAIEANPSYADAYAGLGSAYGFLRRPSEALAALRKAVSLDPTDAITQCKLGTTLGKVGQYQEAIVHLKEAVRLAPTLADAHFALGLAYVSKGDQKKAVDEVNTLSRMDSQQAALPAYSWTLSRSGRIRLTSSVLHSTQAFFINIVRRTDSGMASHIAAAFGRRPLW